MKLVVVWRVRRVGSVPTEICHPTGQVAAVGANHGVAGRDQSTQSCQENIAAGNISDPQVVPTGIRGRNPVHVTLLAQMNQEVARGIANLNSFCTNNDRLVLRLR